MIRTGSGGSPNSLDVLLSVSKKVLLKLPHHRYRFVALENRALAKFVRLPTRLITHTQPYMCTFFRPRGGGKNVKNTAALRPLLSEKKSTFRKLKKRPSGRSPLSLLCTCMPPPKIQG